LSPFIVLAAIAVTLMAILLGAVELGYRRGLRTPPDDTVLPHVTSWEAGLLGLLALLIGFTFAMAVTRFDGRRQLILDEANAIESTWLRARCLDPPVSDQIQALLARYVDARVRFYDAGTDARRVATTLAEGKELQRQLWVQVAAVGRAHPDSEVVSLFVDAADELVQAEARRRAALENHVPYLVFFVLVAVAATGMAATGYSCGLHRRRLPLGMILMPVLIMVVVVLVFDLDHPRAGFIRAGQGAMLRLQQGL
jgi:hypothetical protein